MIIIIVVVDDGYYYYYYHFSFNSYVSSSDLSLGGHLGGQPVCPRVARVVSVATGALEGGICGG